MADLKGKQRRLINRFEIAVRAHETKGAQPKEEHDAIEANYKKAKRDLVYFWYEIEAGLTNQGTKE
jgi:hypothetical protein